MLTEKVEITMNFSHTNAIDAGADRALGGGFGTIDATVPAARRRTRRPWLFAVSLFGGDVAIWFAAYFGLTVLVGGMNQFGVVDLLLPLVVLIAALGLVRGYNPRADMVSLKYTTEHLIACAGGYLLAAFGVYVVVTFGGEIASSRGVMTGSCAAFAILSLAQRRAAWFAQGRFRPTRRLLVIADDKLNHKFYSAYASSGLTHNLLLVATDTALLGKPVDGEGTPCFEATVEDLAHLLSAHPENDFEAVVVAADSESLSQEILGVLATVHFQDMPVYSILAFYETYWEKMPAHLLTPTWPLQAGFHLVKHSVFAAVKRSADLIVAAIACVILSPLLVLIALAVRLDSKGPALFRQTRIGQHRRPFSILKFRTMSVGSETKEMYTAERDPRITRVGAFLRRTRLDELPQLLNVLRGDMSLIGPRAEWIRCVEEYEKIIPHYHFRHLVKPGITGWAQVNYPYGACVEDTIEKLMFDLYYIRNFSLNLDAAVILKTLHVMSFGKGR